MAAVSSLLNSPTRPRFRQCFYTPSSNADPGLVSGESFKPYRIFTVGFLDCIQTKSMGTQRMTELRRESGGFGHGRRSSIPKAILNLSWKHFKYLVALSNLPCYIVPSNNPFRSQIVMYSMLCMIWLSCMGLSLAIMHLHW
jgi:hypothetical protein